MPRLTIVAAPVLLGLIFGLIVSLLPDRGRAQDGAAPDNRELVKLPPMMQAHMLGNMRDHLATLNDILGDIAAEKYDAAAKVAEARLGMSSLSLHGAAHLVPYFPKPMQDIGTTMHHAASRLVIVLQDASVAPTAEAMRKINGALHEVTSACEACHAGYRLR
ncbi:MAG: hypothetical protein GC182_02960 [Rhodopseudomonas sp.]|nr:hypothetical protein [Rhodopseudomonas sp.]